MFRWFFSTMNFFYFLVNELLNNLFNLINLINVINIISLILYSFLQINYLKINLMIKRFTYYEWFPYHSFSSKLLHYLWILKNFLKYLKLILVKINYKLNKNKGYLLNISNPLMLQILNVFNSKVSNYYCEIDQNLVNYFFYFFLGYHILKLFMTSFF
jgi:hypothetical protein